MLQKALLVTLRNLGFIIQAKANFEYSDKEKLKRIWQKSIALSAGGWEINSESNALLA